MSGSAPHREEQRPPGTSAAMWQAIRQCRRRADTDPLPPAAGRGHPEIDRRVLAMTRIIVRKIDADPRPGPDRARQHRALDPPEGRVRPALSRRMESADRGTAVARTPRHAA